MKICGDHPTTANLTTCQHEENGYTMADMPQNKLHPRNIKLFNGKSRIQPWFSHGILQQSLITGWKTIR